MAVDQGGLAANWSELRQYVIYGAVVGSRAYGLATGDSDIDRRGIYLSPASMHWSLEGVPEQIENHETQECYWELEKFLTLALKANPNILECLYSSIVETVAPLAQELLDMRATFLSRMIYQTYNGYAASQFKRIEQDIRNQGSIRWKHAMHLIRLLICGISAMRENKIRVDVSEHRDRLLTIASGEVAWEEVNAWRLRLHDEFEKAYSETDLPEKPDYDGANAFLIKARRSMV